MRGGKLKTIDHVTTSQPAHAACETPNVTEAETADAQPQSTS